MATFSPLDAARYLGLKGVFIATSHFPGTRHLKRPKKSKASGGTTGHYLPRVMSLSLYLSIWPSHAVRCARMASTRSKVVVEGLASSACVRLVMVARHFAHQPLIFLRVAAVRFQDSEPYLATVHIHTLNC